MKPFHYYTNTSTSPPNKRDYETIYLYHAGKVLWEGKWYDNGYPDALNDLRKQYPEAVEQAVLNENEFHAHKIEYQKEKLRLYGEFKQDLFEEFEVSDNPKRFDCLRLAHSKRSGEDLEQLYEEFAELCPLIT